MRLPPGNPEHYAVMRPFSDINAGHALPIVKPKTTRLATRSLFAAAWRGPGHLGAMARSHLVLVLLWVGAAVAAGELAR
jgi:hypothetical protein